MTIGFPHPRSGAYVEFEAPLPDYFETLLSVLRGSKISNSSVVTKIIQIFKLLI